jgi:16S rRNA (uracil1498-N3)-methyltransferase
VTREQRGPRVFVSGLDEHLNSTPGADLPLPPDSSHHIKDVLRLREGEPIELADPSSGAVYRGEIKSLTGSVSVRVIESQASSTTPSPRITLFCALCKGQKNDLICDWATELGTVRSKAARLEKIALAAAQQSRQTKPPAVIVTSTLSDALAVTEEAGDINPCKVLCSLSEGTVPIRAALSKWNDKAPIHIAIGPEGDLTLDEETLLSERGFMRVSLGESVLRSELAVVAAILAARERSIRPE